VSVLSRILDTTDEVCTYWKHFTEVLNGARPHPALCETVEVAGWIMGTRSVPPTRRRQDCKRCAQACPNLETWLSNTNLASQASRRGSNITFACVLDFVVFIRQS